MTLLESIFLFGLYTVPMEKDKWVTQIVEYHDSAKIIITYSYKWVDSLTMQEKKIHGPNTYYTYWVFRQDMKLKYIVDDLSYRPDSIGTVFHYTGSRLDSMTVHPDVPLRGFADIYNYEDGRLKYIRSYNSGDTLLHTSQFFYHENGSVSRVLTSYPDTSAADIITAYSHTDGRVAAITYLISNGPDTILWETDSISYKQGRLAGIYSYEKDGASYYWTDFVYDGNLFINADESIIPRPAIRFQDRPGRYDILGRSVMSQTSNTLNRSAYRLYHGPPGAAVKSGSSR